MPGFAQKSQDKRHALVSQEDSTIETKSRSCERRCQRRMMTRFAWERPLARTCRASASLLTEEGVALIPKRTLGEKP